MPDFRVHAVDVPAPGAVEAQDTRVLGDFLRDVTALNEEQRNFRIFGPDETLSNMLGAVFEATDRQWEARRLDNDEFLAPAGRVLDSMLSEHQCQGWLEGYLLTGRHGLFNCYEAFIHIVDSMFNQHAKWLKVTKDLPWRRDIASLNYLLPPTSGSRTTTASPTRTPASSTMSSTRRPTSCGSTCRRTPTACSRSSTTACAAATTSTSSSPASTRCRSG